MLGKLIKYEFKATGRTFLPLYGLILIVTLLHRFIGRDSNGTYVELNRIGDIATFVLVGLFIALGVITLIVTIQRFSKNLLGDEGYLTFTLPTTSRKLILSKMIVAMVWIVASVIVAAISFGILFVDPAFLKELNYVIGEVKYLIAQITGSDVLLMIQVFILGIMNYVQFLLIVYFALSIGQLPPFQKYRIAVGIIAFVLINMISGWIVSGAVMWIPSATNIFFLMLNLITVILSIVLFEGVNYILNNHLNLE